MIDVRAQLKRSATIPQTSRKLTNFVTIHWNGPAVSDDVSDLQLLKNDAKFHVDTRGWDGLSYHYAVGRDGKLYQARDHMARLAHSGVTQGNNESLAVLVITGDGNCIPYEQWQGLEKILIDLKIPLRYTLGHQEWPRNTSCPGAELMRYLGTKRKSWSNPSTKTKVIYGANVRDEPNVLSLKVGSLSANTTIEGNWVLGKPVKGDSLWFQIRDTTNYVHASALDSKGII